MKKLLMEAGFSDREAEVYEALLKLGEATVDDCAREAGLPRATAYRAIKDILKRGLIGEISGKPLRFFPVDPRNIFEEILKDRMSEVEREKERIPETIGRIIDRAESLYEKKAENNDYGRDLIMLYGKETIRKEAGTLIIHESRKSLYREPLFFPSTLEVQHEWVKEYAEKNITIYLLVESVMLKDPEGIKKIRMYLELGHPVRHLPSFPGKMEVFDEKSALLALRYNENPDKQLAILVNNNDLVGLLNRAFDSLWEEAKPIELENLRGE